MATNIPDSKTKTTTPEQKVSETVLVLITCPTHGEVKHRLIELPHKIRPLTICLSCQQERNGAEADRKAEVQRVSAKVQQERINTRLDNAMITPRFKEKTFENYDVVCTAQRLAITTAYWFLDNLDRSMGLIFVGSNRTGKNHLASAIVKEAVLKHGKTALITKVRKIDRTIKETWRKEGGLESVAIKSFVDPDLLVVDEVGMQRGSESELIHLSEIIDDRYEAMKPTILIGNVTVDEMRTLLGDRAIERFKEGGKVVVFDWKPYQVKIIKVEN